MHSSGTTDKQEFRTVLLSLILDYPIMNRFAELSMLNLDWLSCAIMFSAAEEVFQGLSTWPCNTATFLANTFTSSQWITKLPLDPYLRDCKEILWKWTPLHWRIISTLLEIDTTYFSDYTRIWHTHELSTTTIWAHPRPTNAADQQCKYLYFTPHHRYTISTMQPSYKEDWDLQLMFQHASISGQSHVQQLHIHCARPLLELIMYMNISSTSNRTI